MLTFFVELNCVDDGFTLQAQEKIRATPIPVRTPAVNLEIRIQSLVANEVVSMAGKATPKDYLESFSDVDATKKQDWSQVYVHVLFCRNSLDSSFFWSEM